MLRALGELEQLGYIAWTVEKHTEGVVLRWEDGIDLAQQRRDAEAPFWLRESF